MLDPSGAVNHSGKSVTTLMLSILLIHGDDLIAPPFHRGPRRHTLEAEQPFPVIGAAARHDQRPRQHFTLLIQDVQPRLRNEDRPRILDEGNHRDFPLLAVWLAQPPDYALGDFALLPSTPA